ncbi:DUF202 domain-containing protein, partial [Mycobacterium sp.]|uniref:DUF202 domain-containing protein n=1 Tax=Mycobacterium sp. TaxID=1785 RepID=UPI00344B352F
MRGGAGGAGVGDRQGGHGLSDPPATNDHPANEPADRTALAWTRTSFAFLGNGALLMIKELHGNAEPSA